MKDLYLKTPSYQALAEHLQQHDHTLEGNYYQCEHFIIDYIGKIPKSVTEEGDVIEWSENDRFNVRLVDEDVTIFDGFESINPEIPYRMFS